jgi:hypothetical protein
MPSRQNEGKNNKRFKSMAVQMFGNDENKPKVHSRRRIQEQMKTAASLLLFSSAVFFCLLSKSIKNEPFKTVASFAFCFI